MSRAWPATSRSRRAPHCRADGSGRRCPAIGPVRILPNAAPPDRRTAHECRPRSAPAGWCAAPHAAGQLCCWEGERRRDSLRRRSLSRRRAPQSTSRSAAIRSAGSRSSPPSRARSSRAGRDGSSQVDPPTRGVPARHRRDGIAGGRRGNASPRSSTQSSGRSRGSRCSSQRCSTDSGTRSWSGCPRKRRLRVRRLHIRPERRSSDERRRLLALTYRNRRGPGCHAGDPRAFVTDAGCRARRDREPQGATYG